MASSHSGALVMRPMTPHEKECALAAVAARIENANGKELKEWRKFYKEILQAPLDEQQ